jgi:glycine cleavage system H protein
MEFPGDLKYTKEHEWVRVEGNHATVGITEYAQGELGDIVYVELPEVGSEVEANSPFGSVESVKAVSDLFAPLSGKVIQVNPILEERPEVINSDPYEDGWMIAIEMSDPGELDDLLSAEDYATHIEEEKE